MRKQKFNPNAAVQSPPPTEGVPQSKESAPTISGPFPQVTLSQLDNKERYAALDAFADGLEAYCMGNQDVKTKDKVMQLTGDSVKRTLDVRQFDNCLIALSEEGNLKITPRTVRRHEEKIAKDYHFPNVRVVAGQNATRFARVSAEVFMAEVVRIGNIVKLRPVKDDTLDGYLCIGIVSGSTTLRPIDSICSSSNWEKDFGISKKTLPKIKVFALNVSPTSPKEISYNATIMAQRLVKAFLDNGHEAEAYGLNAQVVVTDANLKEIDQTPQTSDVLRFTEPYRIEKDPIDTKVKEKDTRLDLILTGVGELGQDPKKGSIFYRLAHDAGLDMERIRRESRLVGDLGFAPLNSMGEEVELKKDNKKLIFYSAASLKIFEAMASNPEKAVILVAQSAQKQRIIHASMGDPMLAGSRPRYVSHLVVDEKTAESLFIY